MGPLFSAALLLFFSAITMIVVFIPAKLFLPLRASILMAVATTVSGAIGVAIGLLIQAPFYSQTLQSRMAVLAYLGISCASGCIAAGLAGMAIWRSARRSTNSN